MNTQGKHTKGPWDTGAIMTTVEIWPDGWRMPMRLADCDDSHGPKSMDEKVANARLIAAAPDLAEALAGIMHGIGDGCECVDGQAKGHCFYCMARAALAKAGVS